jgi:uncharacterized protein
MSFSIYDTSLPVFVKVLRNLRGILVKGQAHADARKIDPQALLGARLFPDMFPLVKQVQVATDNVKGAAARLAGLEVPSYPDNETTFPELLARIDKTIDFIQSIKPEQVQGAAERPITLVFPQMTLNFTGSDYLLGFVLPNLYFHAATTYNLLRHNGVELGKGDFLGMR